MRSVSRAAEPVGSDKYTETGTFKLLRKQKERKGEKQCDEYIKL